jgi:hypothetical protein
MTLPIATVFPAMTFQSTISIVIQFLKQSQNAQASCLKAKASRLACSEQSSEAN